MRTSRATSASRAQLGRLARRRVPGLQGALELLVGEGRLVDEDVGLVRGDLEHLARRRVARQHDLAPRAIGAHDLLGMHAVDDLAALQASEVGPEGHAQARRQLGVEAARARLLDDRVAEGAAAVAHVERRHLVAVVGDLVAGLEIDDVERVAQAPVDDPHRAHERDGAGRAVDGQRRLAVAQLEGLEHPGQAQPVVGVVMGEEDGLHVGQPDGAQQLALGPLAAVEEQPVAAAAQQRRGQAATGGRHRARGAGEEEREVHAGGRGYRRTAR